jgi:hypothetical protein
MSLMQVSYLKNQQSIEVECRIFADDLAFALMEEYQVEINFGENISSKNSTIINRFLNQHIFIGISNYVLDLNYHKLRYDKTFNVIFFYFKNNNISIEKNDSIEISNKLFFKQFGALQTNVVNLNLPSISEESISLTQSKSKISLLVR